MPKAKKAKKAKKVKKVLEAPPVEVLIRTQCPHGPSCRHDDPVEEFKMVCEEQKSAVMAAMRAEAEKQARMSRREKAKAKQEPKVIEFTAYCHRSSPTEEMKAKEEDQASELPTPQAPQVLQTSPRSTHSTKNPLEVNQPSQELQLPPDIPRSSVKQVKAYQESEVPQTPLNTPHMAARKTKVAKASEMFQTSSESAQAAEVAAKVDQASCGLQTPSNIPRSTGKKTKNDQASTLPPTPSSTPSCIKKRMKVTTSTDAPQSAELAVEADQGSDARLTSPDSPQTAEIKMKVNLLTEAYQKLGRSPRSAGADIGDDQTSDSHETPPRSPCSGGEDITVDQVSELLQASPDSPQTAEMKAKIELLTRAYQELGISDEESEADTLPPPPKTYENSLLSAKGRGDHSPEAPKDLSSSEEIHETPEDLQLLFDDPELLESIKRFLFYANSSDNDDSASRRRQKPDIYDVKTETDEHIFAMSTNSRLTYIETYQCRAVLVCLREFEMLIKSRSDDHQRIRNVTLKSAKALKNLINTVYNICQSENLLMEVMKRSLEMAFENYCKPSGSS
uniref:C2H2-type domain-containing protein n=1 Tax=Haemonchus contortus TaxID=6289 RepID=A0A7I4Z4G4_HAECO